jgi:hypothetical protein
MAIGMDETRLTTIAQLREFLSAYCAVQFTPEEDDNGRYAHISRVPTRFDYPRLGDSDKGVPLLHLRHTDGYSRQQLVTLFAWTEDEFLSHTEGSPIRRIGHERWQRNIAVAMGNALTRSIADDEKNGIKTALHARQTQATALLAEHIGWALQEPMG